MAFTVTDTALLIVIAIILIFGASKLPDIFRNLGRATGEFKKGQLESQMELAQLQQMQQQPQQSQREKELQSKIDELQKQLDELKKQQSQNK